MAHCRIHEYQIRVVHGTAAGPSAEDNGRVRVNSTTMVRVRQTRTVSAQQESRGINCSCLMDIAPHADRSGKNLCKRDRA